MLKIYDSHKMVKNLKMAKMRETEEICWNILKLSNSGETWRKIQKIFNMLINPKILKKTRSGVILVWWKMLKKYSNILCLKSRIMLKKSKNMLEKVKRLKSCQKGEQYCICFHRYLLLCNVKIITFYILLKIVTPSSKVSLLLVYHL